MKVTKHSLSLKNLFIHPSLSWFSYHPSPIPCPNHDSLIRHHCHHGFPLSVARQAWLTNRMPIAVHSKAAHDSCAIICHCKSPVRPSNNRALPKFTTKKSKFGHPNANRLHIVIINQQYTNNNPQLHALLQIYFRLINGGNGFLRNGRNDCHSHLPCNMPLPPWVWTCPQDQDQGTVAFGFNVPPSSLKWR